jgi:hypothetical protein
MHVAFDCDCHLVLNASVLVRIALKVCFDLLMKRELTYEQQRPWSQVVGGFAQSHAVVGDANSALVVHSTDLAPTRSPTGFPDRP